MIKYCLIALLALFFPSSHLSACDDSGVKHWISSIAKLEREVRSNFDCRNMQVGKLDTALRAVTESRFESNQLLVQAANRLQQKHLPKARRTCDVNSYELLRSLYFESLENLETLNEIYDERHTCLSALKTVERAKEFIASDDQAFFGANNNSGS